MKRRGQDQKTWVGACLWLLAAGQTCMAQGVNEFTGLNKPVKLPFAQATTDDYIIGLAQASEFNFIADATRFPENEEAQPVLAVPPVYAEPDQLRGLLTDLTQQWRLTVSELEPGTLLFWKEPTDDEPVGWARLILEKEKQFAVSSIKPVSHSRFSALFAEYLKLAHGWDGKSQDRPFSIKVSDLPPVLRQAVQRAAYDEARKSSVGMVNIQNWIGEAAWGRAYLTVNKHLGKRQLPDEPPYSEADLLLVSEGPQPHPASNELLLHELLTIFFPMGNGGQEKAPAEPAKVDTAAIIKELQVPAAAEIANEKKAVPAFEEWTAPELKSAVAFSARRWTLGQLLQDAERQSRVKLSLSDGPDKSLAARRLTLHVKDMPLGQLMRALVRLYGARWQQEGPGRYVLHADGLNEIDRSLLPLGDGNWRRIRQRTLPGLRARQQEWHQIAQEVWDNTDEAALRTPEGFPVSQLPMETQRILQEHMRSHLSMGVISGYYKAQQILGPELQGSDAILHLPVHEAQHTVNGRTQKRMRFGRPRLTSADGQRFVEVFRYFSDFLPQEPDSLPPGMQKWLDEVNAKQKAGAAPAKNDVKAAPAR